jgi:hypothetical protein
MSSRNVIQAATLNAKKISSNTATPTLKTGKTSPVNSVLGLSPKRKG